MARERGTLIYSIGKCEGITSQLTLINEASQSSRKLHCPHALRLPHRSAVAYPALPLTKLIRKGSSLQITQAVAQRCLTYSAHHFMYSQCSCARYNCGCAHICLFGKILRISEQSHSLTAVGSHLSGDDSPADLYKLYLVAGALNCFQLIPDR